MFDWSNWIKWNITIYLTSIICNVIILMCWWIISVLTGAHNLSEVVPVAVINMQFVLPKSMICYCKHILISKDICVEIAKRNIFDRSNTSENGIQIIQWHHQFDQKILLTNRIMHKYVYIVKVWRMLAANSWIAVWIVQYPKSFKTKNKKWYLNFYFSNFRKFIFYLWYYLH